LRVNVQEYASAYRSSRASHLDLFDQPAIMNSFFRHTAGRFVLALALIALQLWLSSGCR
jgi:hypothetical protein